MQIFVGKICLYMQKKIVLFHNKTNEKYKNISYE